jgi:hypothetical protein
MHLCLFNMPLSTIDVVPAPFPDDFCLVFLKAPMSPMYVIICPIAELMWP